MDQEKMGKFIKRLREENNLTQEELANKVHIGREAVSKWERGKTCPDSSILLNLSEIFNVSINEILVGERKTKKNIVLELYNDRNKISKKLKKIVFGSFTLVFILLLAFFTYYFISQYKSIHAFTITGFSDKFEINNGLFIKTNGKLFFSLGKIETIDDIDISKVDLYYIENGDVQLIYSSDDDIIYFYDYKGYEEFFDLDKLDFILENLYVNIYYNNEYTVFDSIKLDFIEDYVNDNLFNLSDSSVSNKKSINHFLNESSDLEGIILKKFKKNNENNNIYVYQLKQDELIISYEYMVDVRELVISFIENGDVIKDYIYYFNYNTMDYLDYLNVDNYTSFTIDEMKKCEKNDCYILKEFNVYLQKIYSF